MPLALLIVIIYVLGAATGGSLLALLRRRSRARAPFRNSEYGYLPAPAPRPPAVGQQAQVGRLRAARTCIVADRTAEAVARADRASRAGACQPRRGKSYGEPFRLECTFRYGDGRGGRYRDRRPDTFHMGDARRCMTKQPRRQKQRLRGHSRSTTARS